MELAIVRGITTIDDDGDAAWQVLAISSETHSLKAALAAWPELASPPVQVGEGVGVATPLLFVAVGSFVEVRREVDALRGEADNLVRRLTSGESDMADELAWLARPLRRRGARLATETWRALALRQMLDNEELAEPAQVEGRAGDYWLAAFYAVPPDADAEELDGLAGRGLEVWLHLREQ